MKKSKLKELCKRFFMDNRKLARMVKQADEDILEMKAATMELLRGAASAITKCASDRTKLKKKVYELEGIIEHKWNDINILLPPDGYTINYKGTAMIACELPSGAKVATPNREVVVGTGIFTDGKFDMANSATERVPEITHWQFFPDLPELPPLELQPDET